MILLDTNILAYAFNSSAPQHAESRRVLDLARHGKLSAVLLPQILIEWHSIVTSARRVSLPMTSEQAGATTAALRRVIDVKAVPHGAVAELDRLLVRYPRTGSRVFDLFLVAQMRCEGIGDICTYNVADFALPGIQPLTPAQVLSPAPS